MWYAQISFVYSTLSTKVQKIYYQYGICSFKFYLKKTMECFFFFFLTRNEICIVKESGVFNSRKFKLLLLT